MHEFSFASHIADVVMLHVRKHGVRKVISVSVEIGQFTMIIPQYLSYCYDIIKENYEELKGSRMEITTVAGKIKCNKCNKNTEIILDPGPVDEEEKEKLLQDNTPLPKNIINPSIFTCSFCNSTDTIIVSGKQALVKSMKVDE